MFGVMFGDVGHGALLVLAGLLLRSGRWSRLARYSGLWMFVIGAGLAAVAAGLLYGEFFGPTGVVPVLWVAPLEEPVTLLAAGLGLGAVLLGAAYVVGTVNRWREGRWPMAMVAPRESPGPRSSSVSGWWCSVRCPARLGGRHRCGRGRGRVWCWPSWASWRLPVAAARALTQATVELFDTVIRLGTNLVSFARLAAFGLTHAALGAVVWDATTAQWDRGGLLVVTAVLVFLVGNAIAFSLEALVAGVQALRLEYYELFSRVFSAEGRPFEPWHLPVDLSVAVTAEPSPAMAQPAPAPASRSAPPAVHTASPERNP